MRILTSLFVLLIATGASAQSEVDRAVAALKGREAQFLQRFTPKGFKTSQTESGTVVFGALPMMRWTYQRPEQKLFVFDGTRSWFYVPSDRQATTTTIDDARKRELPFLLLGDPVARSRHFSLSEKRRGGTIVATLQPRDRGARIRSIIVTIDAASHLLNAIEYADRDGNRTIFTLSGYRGANATPETFRFNPPPGVQITAGD